MIIFVAKPGSASYFAARILVVAPAGIAASSTETPVTMESNPSRLQGINTNTGIRISRTAEYRSTVGSAISRSFKSARIIPTTIMDIAVLQFARELIVVCTIPGRESCVSIRKIPIKHAMIHGCVSTFFTSAFTSLLPEKTEIPEDHMTIL